MSGSGLHLNPFPLHLVEADLIAAAVVEAGRRRQALLIAAGESRQAVSREIVLWLTL
jgi:hypothetical protein